MHKTQQDISEQPWLSPNEKEFIRAAHAKAVILLSCFMMLTMQIVLTSRGFTNPLNIVLGAGLASIIAGWMLPIRGSLQLEGAGRRVAMYAIIAGTIIGAMTPHISDNVQFSYGYLGWLALASFFGLAYNQNMPEPNESSGSIAVAWDTLSWVFMPAIVAAYSVRAYEAQSWLVGCAVLHSLISLVQVAQYQKKQANP